VLAWCHADHGCSFEEIRDALLDAPHVAQELTRRPVKRRKKHKGNLTRTYTYDDEKGNLARTVKRYDNPRSFPQEIIDGRMLLFHLPDVIEWVEGGETIYLCEGESDALAGIDADLAATCTPQGAKSRGKIDASMVELLAKTEKVFIVGDNDDSGRKGAAEQYDVLKDGGVKAEVVFPPAPHKDLRDLLEAGGGVGDLVVGRRSPFVKLSEITLKNARPLWKDRIYKGALTILSGEQGHGKSTLTMGLAGLITSGELLPNDPTKRPPGRVLILDYEGALEETLGPRAIACGVDPERLSLLKIADLTNDPMHKEVEWYLQTNDGCAMVVVDPILSALGERETFNGNTVREALKPWQVMANRYDVAIVGLMHMRKAEADRLIHRVSESGAFTQVARSVLYVGKHPESGRRSVSSLKNSLGPEPLPIEFTIDAKDVGVNEPMSYVKWMGEAADLTADAMCRPGPAADKSKAIEDFLWEFLSKEMPATDVIAAAAAAGHAERTVRTVATRMAREETLRKEQRKGVWYWQIRDEE
jgi:energy-coupling factor transporter ATP-binding protein EcfA2